MPLIHSLLVVLLVTFSAFIAQASAFLANSEFDYVDFQKTKTSLTLKQDSSSPLAIFFQQEFAPMAFKDLNAQLMEVTGPQGFKFWLSPGSTSATDLHQALLRHLSTELRCSIFKKTPGLALSLLDKPSSQILKHTEKLRNFLELAQKGKAALKPSDLVGYTCQNKFTDSFDKDYGYDYQVFIIDPQPYSDPETEFRFIITEEHWAD